MINETIAYRSGYQDGTNEGYQTAKNDCIKVLIETFGVTQMACDGWLNIPVNKWDEMVETINNL
jgi:hypothetical protein